MSAPIPRDQIVLRFSKVCDNCKEPTELYEDHAAGDLICTACGLVLEANAIEETSEWRSFSESDKANRADPNRVGGPSNNLLTGGGLGTGIAKSEGSFALSRTHNRTGNQDRALMAAFSAIAEIADRLGLTSVVKDAANELYKNIVEKAPSRGRTNASLHAACLYIACRQEHVGRSFREICGATPNTTAKEISRAYTFVYNQLEDSRRAELTRANLSPKDLVPRICSSLKVESVFIRAAQMVAQRFNEHGFAVDAQVTKQQTSMAAAFVWLVLQLRADAPRVARLTDPAAEDPDAREAWVDETRPADIDWERTTTKRQVYRAGVVTRIEEVAAASGMHDSTVTDACRIVFPHARRLAEDLPADFRSADAFEAVDHFFCKQANCGRCRLLWPRRGGPR